ncbi:MAG: hypothetical protein ACOYMN_05290 [Roseimicrobium sp.]
MRLPFPRSPRLFRQHHVLALSCSFACLLRANDPDLPAPLDLSVAAPLITSPPFTRAIDLSESLALTGIAYVEGKPVVTLKDKASKQSYLVAEKPNALGWQLAEANASAELRHTSVTIKVGPELVTIHYAEDQLAPTSRGGSGPSRWPSQEEVIRSDGKPYVRMSPYLSDADRERYLKGWSREAHDKFRDVVLGQRETMLQASPQQRAELAKKVFDKIDAEEKQRQSK